MILALEFGLPSYFYSNDIAGGWRVSEDLDTRAVGVNRRHVSTNEAPFGVVKYLGLGKEDGRQGLDAFMETKYTWMGDLHPAEEA